MPNETLFSYIVKDEASLPLHLKNRRASFMLPRTEMVLKRPFSEVCPNGILRSLL